MVTTVREGLLAAGLAVFDRDGFDGATVAAIRAHARISNGSFFHLFASKQRLAAELVLEIMRHYQASLLAVLAASPDAREGIELLIRAHLDWVANHRREGRYLFEISRSEWLTDLREQVRAQNERLTEAVERWRAPLLAQDQLLPMTPRLFLSQIIGPAQIFCRAYLSGREDSDPRIEADALVACATRALMPPDLIQGNGAAR
jgi:AcrR family transcriptional regulator